MAPERGLFNPKNIDYHQYEKELRFYGETREKKHFVLPAFFEPMGFALHGDWGSYRALSSWRRNVFVEASGCANQSANRPSGLAHDFPDDAEGGFRINQKRWEET